MKRLKVDSGGISITISNLNNIDRRVRGNIRGAERAIILKSSLNNLNVSIIIVLNAAT
jgi:hypothetical protein